MFSNRNEFNELFISRFTTMFIRHTGNFLVSSFVFFIEINSHWWGLQSESKRLKLWNFELYFFWTLKRTKNINNIWILKLRIDISPVHYNVFFWKFKLQQCILRWILSQHHISIHILNTFFIYKSAAKIVKFQFAPVYGLWVLEWNVRWEDQ